RCSPYYEHTPLYAITDLLSRILDWSRDESLDAKLAKLEQTLTEAGVALNEAIPLLASLLSVPTGGRYELPLMSPEQHRRQTLDVLLSLVTGMAAERSMLFIVEDLHWVDPTTLEFLTLLLDLVPTTRLLALLTARPTFISPWPARSHLTSLTVTRLTQNEAQALVGGVIAGKSLPIDVLQQIVAKTDGVPLFVEEL